jgi:hypothetical protein
MKVIASIVLILELLCPITVIRSQTPARPGGARKTVSLRQGTRGDAAPAVAGTTLPLRRVILYSNGVAYFERRGSVTGNAEITLPFKQSQVDDVLKSMLVLDLGQGQIGAVSYDSSAPTSARLAEIPFSIGAETRKDEEGGLIKVLGQLQGAHVVISTANRSATGSVLNVDEREIKAEADEPPVTSRSVVIASESGEIVSFDLAEVRSVRVLDEGARQDITHFADVSAMTRRRDAKTISVASDGSGSREMAVSYTISAPIWKTTYRVVLDGSSHPFFQGWAIVDNVGEEDWAGVSLSLVSGTPVSFIQPLQAPLFRYRPIIPIPEDLKLDPQVYEPAEGIGTGPAGGIGSGEGHGAGAGHAYGGVGSASSRVAGGPGPLPSAGPVTSLSDAIASESSGVTAAATGAQVGDLFEYHIDQSVTVKHDRSGLIPILQTRMEGERVSIYNEEARKDRPMGGLRLKNTSVLTLEGGPITVIDGDAYAGEALMERLKPGEERFISYAVDLGTLVDTTSKQERERVFLVRAVKGSFQAHYYKTEKKNYILTNQTDQARVVFIEHPFRKDWKLSDDTAKPSEKTASVYRFRIELGPHATVEFPVREQLPLMDTYAISNLTRNDMELFISQHYLDESSRLALEGILTIREKIGAQDVRLAAADREIAEISADQSRLRENIKALKDTAEARQLIARYVAKAGDQESRIEQLTADRKTVVEERARLQEELDKAIKALSLDRKL